MSDRRPSKPEDGYATQLDNLAALMGTNKAIRETTGTILADSVSAALLGYADLLRDPVAVVRRGVESGTIKGEVVRWCRTHNAESIENHGVGLSDECWRVVWVPHDEPEGVGNRYALCRIVERLVVSDGGSET